MTDQITGKTIRIPRQMVAEWDAVFEAVRAEVAERYGSDVDDLSPRQVWTEVVETLTKRYLLGDEPTRAQEIGVALNFNNHYLRAIAKHLGMTLKELHAPETEQDDS